MLLCCCLLVKRKEEEDRSSVGSRLSGWREGKRRLLEAEAAAGRATGAGGESCSGRRGELLGPAGRAAGGCSEEEEREGGCSRRRRGAQLVPAGSAASAGGEGCWRLLTAQRKTRVERDGGRQAGLEFFRVVGLLRAAAESERN
ncbi:unnamed protein product [Linum trigynum]|uniref:Uncharacterized protein n=1 Tax=Linum trigynum TaxID=586398 RepID=A0AAV2C8U1_9ROSI